MTEFQNQNDRTTLGVDHDAHGCTVLTINPNDDKNNPVVFGVPSDQLPIVLLDMAGGMATESEHENALDILNSTQATLPELISTVRETLLALHIRTVQETLKAETLPDDDTPPDADAPNYEQGDAELDDMSRAELLAEAKALRADTRQLLREHESIRDAMHQLEQRFQGVNQVLLSIHQGITAVVAENNPGAADA
jgi:arginine decarboxylase-like protein